MSELLYIRPEDPQARHWHWRRVDGGAAGEGALGDAAELTAGRRTVLVVPGERVLLTGARLPIRSRSRAAAAVPWALEDRLTDEVDGLHFALGTLDSDGEWAVAVVARAYLDRCLGACAEAGVSPVMAVPEPLALPVPESGCWTALAEAGRVVCRTGTASGFACAATLLPEVVRSLETPTRISLTRVGDTTLEWPDPFADRLHADATVPNSLEALVPEPARDTLDLLQGPYSRRERLSRAWHRWRVPTALAATLVVLLAIHWGLGYRELGQRQQMLESATETILREAVPDIGRIVDPRVQLRNRLEAARGTKDGDATGFLSLLRRVGPALARRDDIDLTELEWRDGTLDLNVEARELPAVDQLQRALRELGVTTELRGVQRDEDIVRGRVRIEEPGA